MALTPFIGVDWGSTHMRAFRYADDGVIADTRRGGHGAASLPRDAFEVVLIDFLGSWLEPAPQKIVICGMAGAREGWVEAPYLPCPMRLSSLAGALARPDTILPVHIAPGLSTKNVDGALDVMRGEETQMYGASTQDNATIVTPGTHSKWAVLSGGVIESFQTYMTGEVFALLSTHSALAKTIDASAAFDGNAFDRGAERALSGGALTRLAFGVRVQSLLGALTAQAAKSYLSGLVIGSEIVDALKNGRSEPLIVIGAGEITELYRRALALASNSPAGVIDGEAAAARGLWRIACAEVAS